MVFPAACTVGNSQNYVQYCGPLSWITTDCTKDSKTLDIFNNKLRKWSCIDCTCYYHKKL